ncbi:MAG: peroxidase-related enzyme [Hyphomicrobiaceae bacterium]|nr:peroxidase-related enzyme [Hyphomicrobiaceae bacterium]
MPKKVKQTALDLGPEARLDADNAAYFAKCEEKLGFVPNVLRAYAFDNAKLRAFIQMADDLMLGDSGLSKAEREMIAVAVSTVNHCHYCLTSHGAALRQRAGDPELGELIAQNWRAATLEPRHEAMLEFCVKLTEAPDKMREADREALRRAGFSDRDIWDIAAVAGFYNMTNRVAAATDMKPNPEYHYLARERAGGAKSAAATPAAGTAPAPAPPPTPTPTSSGGRRKGGE